MAAAMPSLLAVLAALLLVLSPPAAARVPGVYTGGDWQSAHATFYGGSDASGTMGTRGVRVREPVQPGVRGEQRGAEHGALQRGAALRRLLRDPVREPAGVGVVPAGEAVHHRHRHQLLPAQLRAPLRRRRLVQPSPPPLRPRHAHVPPHGPVPRRHRPRLLPPGAVPEVGRCPVHHQRVQVLQPGAHHQRGRGGGPGARQRQGLQHRVDAHVPQLGPELAVQLHPRRPGALLPRHRQRPPHLHLLERRTPELALRPDLRGQELQGLMISSSLLLRHRRWSRRFIALYMNTTY